MGVDSFWSSLHGRRVRELDTRPIFSRTLDCLPAAVWEMSALLLRKGEPEVAAEIEPNRAPLFHSLLSLQMTTTQVNPDQTVLECCLLSQIKADKNRGKISRESYSNQEGTDASEFVIYPVVGHDGSVTSVNFSHDNNWLLTSSCDRTVRLWSHSQSDPLLTLLSVNHNFATELGSSAKLKVSGLIYFGDPLFASGGNEL